MDTIYLILYIVAAVCFALAGGGATGVGAGAPDRARQGHVS
jgi:hypothetical protein